LSGGAPDGTLRVTVGVSREQVGSALRRLAQDLIAERRRVADLERENRELRARIEALERPKRARKGRTADPPAAA
jgi:hypothetical protein